LVEAAETEQSEARAPHGSPLRTGTAFYVIFGALTLLLASLPHLIGWLTTPAGHVYSGLTTNIDDSAVYLTYLRQASEGRFFQTNQFTTEPQHSYLFNLLFLLLGNIARLTHLPLVLVYNLGRFGFGALLLWLLVLLLREAVADERARRIGFALACVSGGFGFLFINAPGIVYSKPVDVWQPEAHLFASLSYTVLFVAGLAGIAWFAWSLLRSERTGRWRDLWPAALAIALLADFHSYDVLPLLALASAYRVVSSVTHRRVEMGAWLRLAALWAAALPLLAYQFWALKTAGVLANREQEATMTGSLATILLGFGLVLILAVVAPLLPEARRRFASPDALRFLLVWAVVGIAITYLPVNFQRKLLMGAQIPLCLLAGPALAALTSRLSGALPVLAAGAVVIATTPTHLMNLMDTVGKLEANAGSHLPYLTTDERDALRWLHDHTARGDAVLVAPDRTSHLRLPGQALWPHLSVYVPALAGNTVYNGHWSETTDFKRKLNEGWTFFRRATPDEARRAFLEQSGVKYVLYLNNLADGPITDAFGNVLTDAQGAPVYDPVRWPNTDPVPSFLVPVYSNAQVTLYRVDLGR